jgi:hypothetical protein
MNPRERGPILFFLLIFAAILILVIGLQVNNNPRRATPQPASGGAQVAILVVDAFEASTVETGTEPLPTVTPPPETDYCLTTPDGEPHVINSGAANRPISGVANRPISGVANRPISGVSGQVLVDPHGRLVYHELESLIRNRGGSLQELHLGQQIGAQPWIRDIGRWQMLDGKEILLVAVDTDGYTTEVIGPRINEAIQYFTGSSDFKVDQFVVNMSFVILPCGDLQDPVDYAAMLQQPEFEDLRKAIDTAIENGEDVLDVLVSNPQFAAFREQALKEMSDDYRANLASCYERVVSDQKEPNDLQSAAQAQGQSITQDVTRTPTPDTTVTPIASNTQLVTERCQPLLAGNDSLARGLTVLVEEPGSVGASAVIPVGASGNSGYSYAFAPGYWPNVVSVSADYTGWETCNPSVTPTNAIFAPPLGNSGEVIMGGLYNCLNGTSFAAPRLSLEAAIYLSRGGAMLCTGSNSANNGVDSPPLAYIQKDGTPIFEDLERVEASNQYCTDFNTLMAPTP